MNWGVFGHLLHLLVGSLVVNNYSTYVHIRRVGLQKPNVLREYPQHVL